MNKALFLFSLVSFSINTYSQSNGVYVSQNDDLVIIKEDSIAYRFLKSGGFISFKFGLGTFHTHKSQLEIKTSNDFRESSSSLEINGRNLSENVVGISIFDSYPEKNSYNNYTLILMDSLNNKLFGGIIDQNGKIEIDLREHINLANKNLTLHINDLIFSTIKRITLVPGYNYVIKSLISQRYPISWSTKDEKRKLKIENITDTSFVLKDKKEKRELIFKKKRNFTLLSYETNLLNILLEESSAKKK